MVLFKIFSTAKKAYWQQDCCGYVTEEHAGRWTLAEIVSFGLDDEQVVFPCSITGKALKAIL